jgi:hypothetical protein
VSCQTLGQCKSCQGNVTDPFVHEVQTLSWLLDYNTEGRSMCQRRGRHTRCRLGHTGYLMDCDVYAEEGCIADQSSVWISKLREEAGDLLLQSHQHRLYAEGVTSNDATEMQWVALRDCGDSAGEIRTQLVQAIGGEVGTHRRLTQASELERCGFACKFCPQLSPLNGHVLKIISACQEHKQTQVTPLTGQKARQEERRGVCYVGIIKYYEIWR